MESVADLGFEFTRKKKYLVSIPNLIKEHIKANIAIEREVGSYQPKQLSMIWCSYNDLPVAMLRAISFLYTSIGTVLVSFVNSTVLVECMKKDQCSLWYSK